MGFVADNLRATRQAQRWKSLLPHPARKAWAPTSWDEWLPILHVPTDLGHFTLTALPKRKGEDPRFVVTGHGERHEWINTPALLKQGAPWERRRPLRPTRRRCTTQEVTAGAALEVMAPAIAWALNRDWRLCREVDGLLEILRAGHWELCRFEHGCAAIREDLGDLLSPAPDAPPCWPPGEFEIRVPDYIAAQQRLFRSEPPTFHADRPQNSSAR